MTQVASEVEPTHASQLGADAYEWILHAIATFQFPVNAKLGEIQLAKEIGISRTPVREALQRLEKEGLVRRGLTARFTVALLTPGEVDEACDVLSLLDSYMFCRAAERISLDQTAELMGCAQAMLAAAGRGDVEAWGVADDRFHEIVLEMGCNITAAEMARLTRRRIQRFSTRSLSANPDRFTACSSEHVAIARAIAERRVADIPKLVDEHVGHMRRSLMDSLAAIATFLGREP